MDAVLLFPLDLLPFLLTLALLLLMVRLVLLLLLDQEVPDGLLFLFHRETGIAHRLLNEGHGLLMLRLAESLVLLVLLLHEGNEFRLLRVGQHTMARTPGLTREDG